MKKRLFGLVACAMVYRGMAAEKFALPTNEEISAARKGMPALMATGLTPDELLTLAAETTHNGEKYLLYRQAFLGFAKKGSAAFALGVLDQYVAAFENLPDDAVVSLLTSKTADPIRNDVEIARRIIFFTTRVSAAKQLNSARAALRKSPENEELQCRIGEAEVTLGNWKGALRAFEKGSGEISRVAKNELLEIGLVECANFWWDYTPTTKATLKDFYREHAVALYHKALESSNLSVVEKAIAEKRICASKAAMVKESAEPHEEKKLVMAKSKAIMMKEISALKRICDTKGLVHCWRLNGDLSDCVGGCEAATEVVGTLGEKDLVVDSAKSMTIGQDVLPQPCQEFTIEVWATWLGMRASAWGRCINLHKDSSVSVYQGWNCGKAVRSAESVIRWGGGNNYSREQHGVAPFEVDVEYHIAIVFKRIDDKPMALYIKQDAQTGATLSSCKVVAGKKSWTPAELGSAKLSVGGDCKASFNEVRIWNRALSEKELTENAIKFHKAGETLKR